MPRTLDQIEQDFARWLESYLLKKAPTMTARGKHTFELSHVGIFRASMAMGKALSDARASAEPDIAAVEQVAKTLCYMWIAALKDCAPVAITDAADTPVIPQTPLEDWLSRVLGEPMRIPSSVPYTTKEVRLLESLRLRNPDAFPEWLRWIHGAKALMEGFLEPAPPLPVKKDVD